MSPAIVAQGVMPPMTRNQKCLLWYVLLGPVLLVVAVFGNELIGWLEVQNELRLCREAGMELDPEKLIPPPVPEEQNAAPLLLDAFKDLDPIPFEATEVLSLLSVKGGPMQKDLLVEAKGIADEYEPILQRIDEAIKRRYCRYEPWPHEVSGIYGPSLAHQIAFLHSSQVVYDYLALGADSAYQRVRDVFHMRKAMGEERQVLRSSLDTAIINLGVGKAKMLLEDTERPSADTVRLLLSAIPRRQDIVALWRRNVGPEVGGFLLKYWSWSQPGWFRITRPFEATHKAFAIRMYRRLHREIGVPVVDADARGWPKDRWYCTFYLSHRSFGGWRRDTPSSDARDALVEVTSIIANAELARLALLVELHWHEHGDYPEALDELVMPDGETMPNDPFDGKPYRYRKLADGYRLWSISKNCVDDGGTVNDDGPWESDIVFWIGPSGKAAREAAREETWYSEEEKQDALEERREEAREVLDEFRTEWKQYEADKKAGLLDDEEE
jgi:hypothetical protein